MKSFSKLVGSFPFSGKLLLRPVMHQLHNSMTRPERMRNFRGVMLILAFFVFAHAAQAYMGFRVLASDLPFLSRFVGSVYAGVNLSVTAVQIYLGFRAIKFLFSKGFPRAKRKPPIFTAEELVSLGMVTIGGQLAFLLVYQQLH